MLHRGDAGAHRRRSRKAVGGRRGRGELRFGVRGGDVQAAEDQAVPAAAGEKKLALPDGVHFRYYMSIL